MADNILKAFRAAVCFKASRRLAMRLTYGGLEPSAGVTMSERRLAAPVKFKLSKENIFVSACLIYTSRLVFQDRGKKPGPGKYGRSFGFGIFSWTLQSWWTEEICPTQVSVPDQSFYVLVNRSVKERHLYKCEEKKSSAIFVFSFLIINNY